MTNTHSPSGRVLHESTPPSYSFTPVRTRALEAFESSPQPPKLTAIVAPVGYGKTVFLNSLYKLEESRGRTCYWCSLGEGDSQVEDVLQRLESHSRRLSSHASHPTQDLFRGGETWHTRIDRLLDLIHGFPRPFTVFIDNLHFCHDSRLRQLLDRLAFATPNEHRFIFSSTAGLPLNMVKARLEGQIQEFSFQELKLELDGVAALLGPALCTQLGDKGLATVLDQTEGWPAAVRMMQIAMHQSSDPVGLLNAFSGSDQDLVALLSQQVLESLDDELLYFLLRLALLETFDASLANHVTGDSAAARHIRHLVDHNLFVIPLDGSRYRLHGLMRQYLLKEAQVRLDLTDRQQVQERAALWCESHHLWRDAVEYALECNALELAARVLNKSAKGLVRNHGDIPRYVTWVNYLMDQGQALEWESEYWYVWALVLNQRYEEGSHQLARLQKRLQRACQTVDDKTSLENLEQRLGIIRMCIDVFVDELDAANEKASDWLSTQTNDDPFNITVSRCICSMYASSRHDFLGARHSIMAAKGSALQTQSHYALAWIEAITALPLILEGQYAVASQALLEALETLPSQLGESSGIIGTISLLAASCLVEMGREKEASPLIEQGLKTAHAHGFVDALSNGVDAALKLCDGDGNPWMKRIEDVVSHYPTRLAYLFGCHRIRRNLRLGRIAEALREANTLGLNTVSLDNMPAWATDGHGRDVLTSTLADIYLAEPTNFDIAQWLDELYKCAKQTGRTARMVDIRLMQTVLFIREDRRSLATRRLTQAITLAATHNIVRPFHDRAQELAPLIEETRPSAWNFARPIERELFAHLCNTLPISDPCLQERLLALNVHSHLLEPLTRRQLELLQLMETGLSNQQIADHMELSLSTIKGHSQNLYAKLGVRNRSAALAKARVLKLI